MTRQCYAHLFSPRFQDRLKDLNSQADSLMTSSAFDTSQVKDKRETINGRFQRIKSMAAARRAKLNESHRLHQFFRDMDDEESWIKCVFWKFEALAWGHDVLTVSLPAVFSL